MPRHNGTRGCSMLTPPPQGEQVLRLASGLSTAYRISAPAGYRPGVPQPLLLALHGWGMGHASEAGWHQHGQERGYLVVTPTGYSEGGGFAASWNGAGSVASPGPLGPTCAQASSRGNCYPSCGACRDGCWWTTCRDSVGQVASLLDEVMGRWCVARQRVYATGLSNGGSLLFELARDARTSGRIAAYLPTHGLPHAGFNAPPAHRPVALLGLWGLRDPFVPPRPNPSQPSHPGTPNVSVDTWNGGGGWYYTVARAVTATWAAANGCQSATPAQLDVSAFRAAPASLACVGWTRCSSGARVVECVHDGEHEPPSWRGDLFWDFARGAWPPRLRAVRQQLALRAPRRTSVVL